MLGFLASTLTASISNTKLRNYLSAQSLITVTELGADGKSIDQIGLTLPIFAK
jgi:hypothetical protein